MARWRGALDRITRTSELNDLLSRQSDVKAAQDRLADVQRQAEQIKVTDESLTRIRQAAEDADRSNAQLRVAATLISFDIPSGCLAGIEADGAPPSDPPTMIEAVEPVEITVPERGRILVEPAVAELEEKWPASARSQLEARVSRLETAIRQREKARVDTRLEIVRLGERIEVNDGAGVDEAIEHTQHELEQATRRRDRFERELEVLDLLADTLLAAESEARERYLAPVVGRVHPYLRMLFPNAEIGMNEDLNIPVCPASRDTRRASIV